MRKLAVALAASAMITLTPAAASAAPASHDSVINTCQGGWAQSQSIACLAVRTYGTKIIFVSGEFGVHRRGAFWGFWRITMPGKTIQSWEILFTGPAFSWHWYLTGNWTINRWVPFNSRVCFSGYQGTPSHAVLLRQDCGYIL